MNRHLEAMYAAEGRPSIPPERLLKENLFVEQLLKPLKSVGKCPLGKGLN